MLVLIRYIVQKYSKTSIRKFTGIIISNHLFQLVVHWAYLSSIVLTNLGHLHLICRAATHLKRNIEPNIGHPTVVNLRQQLKSVVRVTWVSSGKLHAIQTDKLLLSLWQSTTISRVCLCRRSVDLGRLFLLPQEPFLKTKI